MSESGQLRTMLYRVERGLAIMVHGSVTPTNAEWQQYLDALAEVKTPVDAGVLVVTDGASPSASQREAMNRRYPLKVRVAVLTASPMARGVATLLSWFNPWIRSFPPPALFDALAYLRVDPSRHRDVVGIIGAMRMELADGDMHPGAIGAELLREHAIEPMDAVVTRLSKLREDLAKRRVGRQEP